MSSVFHFERNDTRNSHKHMRALSMCLHAIDATPSIVQSTAFASLSYATSEGTHTNTLVRGKTHLLSIADNYNDK